MEALDFFSRRHAFPIEIFIQTKQILTAWFFMSNLVS